MVKHDFYEGFEGEPEFIATLKDAHTVVLSGWIGYFDGVMARVKPGPDGWEGIAAHYHLNTGYYETVWRDPNPALTATMVQSVLPHLTGKTLRFASLFAQIAERAAASGTLELEIV